MDRQEFLFNVSTALGRTAPPSDVDLPPVRYPYLSDAQIAAEKVRINTSDVSTTLLDDATENLTNSGWKVYHAETIEDVGNVVAEICCGISAETALRSGDGVLDEALINPALERVGIELRDMTLQDGMSDADRNEIRSAHREEVFRANVGITGGDYVIAETGTLVIHPKKGVSRLISLAPPVHIAVMKRNQVLPSLDDLFLLEHIDLNIGEGHAAMNLISGPSRTGDIEATIVYGIHGPVETHIVLVS